MVRSGKMKKILVIEDEYPVRTSIRDLLEEKEYRVFTAGDGKEGLQLAREIIPDLIICDVMMPCMDGYEVIRQLNGDNKALPTPFIFLTAKADMKDLREAMDLGADDYLVKPFKAVQLLKAIETRLGKFEKIRQSDSPSEPEGIKSEYNKTEADSLKEEKLREESRLFISSGGKSQFIRVSDIVLIRAESEYSTLFLSDQSRVIVRKLLKAWEETLPETLFLRVHRSEIINLNFIDKIEKWYQRSYIIRMKGIKEPITVSRRYASRIKSHMFI